MLSWLLPEWLYSKFYYAPARNIPENIEDIKKFVESIPPDIKTITTADLVEAKEKLIKVETSPFVVTQKDLQSVITKLNKTEMNTKVVTTSTPPLLKEFNDVFAIGIATFLEQQRLKRVK